MRDEKWFPEGGSPLRTGTGEPPPSLTDVSLRQVGVVRGWPVPAVPWWFPMLGTTHPHLHGEAGRWERSKEGKKP
jgi:hypothetical protein